MFRLRQVSGEEAIFRSVDELALGLRSGIIGAFTDILDGDAWSPLTDHPLYPEIVAISESLMLAEPLETLEPDPVVLRTPRRRSTGETPAIIRAITPVSGSAIAVAPGTPGSIYQMFSKSAAELQARRRPKAFLRVLIGAGGVFMLVAATYIVWREGKVVEPEVVHGAVVLPDAHPPRASFPVAAASGASPATSTPSRPLWLSPAILAERRDEAITRLDDAFADTTNRLALTGLLSLGRLNDSDSVRLILHDLTALAPLVERYRDSRRRLVIAYKDSATAEVRSDRWSLLDANEWRSREGGQDLGVDAERIDSVMGAITALYQVLAAQEGRYELTAVAAEFSAWRASVDYQRLRMVLLRHGPGIPVEESRPAAPLLLLLRGLVGPDLPAVKRD